MVSGYFKKQTVNSFSELQCVSTNSNTVSEALPSQLDTVTDICNTEESTTIALDACLGIAQSHERPNDASSNRDSDSDIESDIENVKNYSHLLACTSNGERREDTAMSANSNAI